jgi:hypothetical protein
VTSINAIRFDGKRGAIVVDETISSGGNMSFLGSDKVRSCIPQAVQKAYGTVAGLAGTGSCSFSGTVKQEFHDWILAQFRNECEKAGGHPKGFYSLDRMAKGLFDLIIEVKNRRLSEKLRGDFGFDVPEFIEGRFSREGKTEEIRDQELIRKVTDWLSYRHQNPEVGGIFLNALLFAGYDDECGFQLYHLDLRDGYWHRVQTCYMAEGSGRFGVDPNMYPLVERLRVDQRRGDVDPVEGLATLLAALNNASEHEVGVGGYPNVMLFDGNKPLPERQREVGDDRAWLASRAVKAYSMGYLNKKVCFGLVEGIFFGDLGLEDAWERLWSKVQHPDRVQRLLRGYKVGPNV